MNCHWTGILLVVFFAVSVTVLTIRNIRQVYSRKAKEDSETGS